MRIRTPWRASAPIVLLAGLFVTSAGAQTAKESRAQYDSRMRWWREAKFGMFIHWGIYAVPADSTDLQGKKQAGEWYLNNKRMQAKAYEKFASQFNPVKFDAKTWVKTAKATGMKYMVITSKHHDGFCMFDTKLTDYCVTRATPWKRDPMKELAAECRRQGIKFCFYYSIMDWHHPDYLPRRDWDERPVDGASLNRYIEGYMKGQLRELLRTYGPLGILWWDGAWEHSAEELHSYAVNSMIRSLQPSIIVTDRNRLREDYLTPEQMIPANGLPGERLWETCMTINDTWGYAKNDTNWKSAEDLIRKLVDIASKGGNFLLNVGPTAEGVFPDAINERLARIGAWMKVNGQSIYGTTGSPFRKLPFDGRCTVKSNKLYLEVFTWPSDGLTLTDLETPVIGARALESGEELSTNLSDTDGSKTLHIQQPKKLDPIATVVELQLSGPPKVARSNLTITAEASGGYMLPAVFAEIHSGTAQYGSQICERQDFIRAWTKPRDYASWTINVPQGGRYRAEISYACPAGNEGSRFTVSLEGGALLPGTVKATKSETDFRNDTLGELALPAGSQVVAVRISALSHGAAMYLHELRLVPLR